MTRGALALVLSAAFALGGCRADVTSLTPLELTERRLLSEDEEERMFALRFEDPAGRPLDAYLREPATPPETVPDLFGALLVAGRETGREAAAVIPPPLGGVVLAVEYPEAIPEDLHWRHARRVLAMRRASLRMPGVLRGAARHLVEHPRVDSTRVALIGVSFGVPFAAPAARDPVFDGVGLFFGGADLALLLEANLPIRRYLPRRAAAVIGAWFFRELEPSDHVAAIAPTPLLLINGVHDAFVPVQSAARLKEAAQPPVHQIWLPYEHVMPWELEIIREMADSAVAHFDFMTHLPGPPPAGR